jgi:hypothetical protein
MKERRAVSRGEPPARFFVRVGGLARPVRMKMKRERGGTLQEIAEEVLFSVVVG